MATKPQDTTAFTDPNAELAYIRQQAKVFGLDPGAVLAVAAHEGVSLPSMPGDQGTSFGPWQLHAVSGRLPSSIWQKGPDFSQQWANSPAGLNYALAGISGVARGQTGETAITSIVSKFEQPRADLQAGEIAASVKTYQSGGGPAIITPSTIGGTGSPGYVATYPGLPGEAAAGNAVNNAAKVAEELANVPGSILGVLQWPFKHNRILRLGELLAGAALVIIGLLMLTKGLTLAGAAGAVAKAGR